VGLGSLMVLGIEGRSVVGNLRIVVSWSSRWVGAILIVVCCQSGPVSAQDTPPAATKPPAASATEATAVETPAAEALPSEAPAAQPAVVPPPKAAPVVYAEPRITEDESKKWNSTRSTKLQSALKSSAPNTAETKELIDAGTMFIDRMTIPKNISDLHLKVIDPARRSVDGPSTNSSAKKILLKAMADRGLELLTQKPPHDPDVQLGIVILLGTLNSQPPKGTATAVPYIGSAKALIAVLENSDSPLQCRIAAATGLGRMGREAAVGVSLGDLSVVQRNEIATSLAKALLATEAQGNDDGKIWFRSRVAEALGDCGVASSLTKAPVFIDALMVTVTNPGENVRVRASAIRAVTQLQWDGQTNFPLVLSEAVKLCAEIANQYNASVEAKRPVSANLRHANLDVYLAFRPKTDKPTNPPQAIPPTNWGFVNQTKRNGLTQYEPAVKAAYDVILPVVNAVLVNENRLVAISPAVIAPVEAWITANLPSNRKPTPVSPQPVP